MISNEIHKIKLEGARKALTNLVAHKLASISTTFYNLSDPAKKAKLLDILISAENVIQEIRELHSEIQTMDAELKNDLDS